MDFDNVETAMNMSLEIKDGSNKDDDLSVAGMINRVMRPSGKRKMKLTISQRSPSAEEKLQHLMQSKHYSKPKQIRHISTV